MFPNILILILIVFLILVDLGCLLGIGLQVRATYTPLPRKSRVLRSILAGFLFNIGLVSAYILIGLLKSESMAGLWNGAGSFELGALLLQALLTLALFGVFQFRDKARRHYEKWDLL